MQYNKLYTAPTRTKQGQRDVHTLSQVPCPRSARLHHTHTHLSFPNPPGGSSNSGHMSPYGAMSLFLWRQQHICHFQTHHPMASCTYHANERHVCIMHLPCLNKPAPPSHPPQRKRHLPRRKRHIQKQQQPQLQLKSGPRNHIDDPTIMMPTQ